MKVRAAVAADLKQCVSIDHDLSTDHVWQIDRREENGSHNYNFHPVRLPRTMRVRYPRSPEQLWADWRRWHTFLVAENDGIVHGYLGMLAHESEGTCWIRDLVVTRPSRRQGVGTALLKRSLTIASQHQLHRITIEMQSKNSPAIRFCQKHGFRFCGFNESYYPNGDIALFFTLNIR